MKRKILLMEDEAVIREVLVEYLTMADYQVSSVEDGHQAMELIEQSCFDLAVLDIMVPGPDGLEILSAIRERCPDTAVIMLSALEDEGTQLKAFNREVDDYVIKPFSPILLLKRIQTILRRAKPSLPKDTESDRLWLQPESYEAYYKGESLDLTLSEFLILKELMERPGWVLSREALIEAVYQEDYYGSDRVIDSYIKNLRKKLPIQGIKTVVGVGYRWEEEA